MDTPHLFSTPLLSTNNKGNVKAVPKGVIF